MKIVNKITGILLLLVLSWSCSDFFDLDLENGVKADEFYDQTRDVNAVAYGIYGAIAPEVHKLFLWGSARADLVTGGNGKDAFVTEFINNTVTNVNPYTDYGFLYKAIARCNHQLENLPRMKPDGDKITEFKWHVFYGEAYFLRAWCYFQLVRTFDKVPLVLEDLTEEVRCVTANGDTVILNTMQASDDQLRALELKPADKREVWKTIVSDLNKAIELLDENLYYYPNFEGNTQNSAGMKWWNFRGNLEAAYTLAAEVSLWIGDDEKALAYADYVVKKGKLGSYGYWSGQYTGNDLNTAITYNSFAMLYQYSGGMFSTQRMQEFTSPIGEDGGRYLVKPAIAQVNNLFDDENDKRKKFTCMRYNRQEVIWKYIGLDEEGESMRLPYRSDAFYYLVKHSDAWFVKAVALARRGNYVEAFQMLNDLRRNRGAFEYTAERIPWTAENALELLFRFRAAENAFEGKRWYDLLLRETVFGETGIIAETVAMKYPVAERNAVKARLQNEKNWYLPIEPERWK